MKIKYNEAATCPLCGSRNVELLDTDTDDSIDTWHTECRDCETQWEQLFTLEFQGIDHVKSGNKAILINKEV